MRLLLVGAFPYPHPQGSQVYFQEQAIALRAAGVDVELLTYASGTAPHPARPNEWRALDGFVHHRAPAFSAPRSLRSGPAWGKPLADIALAGSIRRVLAAQPASGPFDAILAHNAEACAVSAIALASRPGDDTPLVYCVHTLLGKELSAYLRAPDSGASRIARRALDRIGGRVDHRLARRADGWIALTPFAAHAIRRSSTAVGALIPPPVPDPRQPGAALDPEATARRHGLEPGRFDLYSGNLDAYQELGRLVDADRARRESQSGADEPAPIVVASHDPAVLTSERLRASGLVCRHVPSPNEMNALLAAARSSLVLRRAPGGYPIKLANSLAVGTPPIAFLSREWGLSHDENALIAEGPDPTRAFASALGRLDDDPTLAARLGRGARRLYEEHHLPEDVAERTLELIARLPRSGSQSQA